MSQFTSLFTGQPGAQAPEAASPAPRYRILLVDDEPNVLKALVRVFHRESYEVLAAANGAEALALLERQTCQVLISDFKMPSMNGGELLRACKSKYPDMIRIMLTGDADVDAVLAAVKEGAVYKFILKPWNDDDLRVTVSLALEQYDLVRKNRALQESNQDKSRELNRLAGIGATNRSQTAVMLHKRGLLNDRQVQELHKLQQARKEPMLKLLLEKDWVKEAQIRDILRKEFLVEEVALPEFPIDPAVAALLPRGVCERQWVLPLKLEGRRLMLAMADPLDLGLIDDLRFRHGYDIQPVMADVGQIREKIHGVFGAGGVSFEDLETLVSNVDPYEGIEIVIEDDEDVSLEDLLRGTDEPPAIRLVNVILLEAVRLGASDVHVQPRAKSVAVRYRIDGVLHDKIHIPPQLHQALVSRIKVMAELDITERRRPQDGRLAVKTPLRMVDVRLSTLPTVNGEKIVLRILDRNAAIQNIGELGFAPDDLERVRKVIARPQGIVLATGPTGSGKTTTLYSLLQHNASPAKNYVTIEDPVEYYMDMAGQVAVRDKIGLDFATVLRAILRQDPDVILLGEIRDHDTAEVAFHAALTGHLVFSTLHTNSAVATVARLFDLGLKPYVIANALEAVIAQRLVRRLCSDCREPEPMDPARARLIGWTEKRPLTAFRARGCIKCNDTGFRGRTGVYELLVLDEAMRRHIADGKGALDLARHAEARGMTTLVADALRKVERGDTSADEVLRVLGPQVVD
jgi:type II secretory ATPase GspE/PulE/Tfp pilus assembly ATPase PilB-like protein/FixJ family two-component response regulator